VPNFRVLSEYQAPPDEEWRPAGWGDPPWGRSYRSHPLLGYEHKPGADIRVPLVEHASGTFRFRTNNLGLRRDANTAAEKPAGTFRILVLGDSHTDGYVDNAESFATLLERDPTLTAALAGQRVESLNAGVAGYSPAEQYLWYEQNGARLHPDLVVSVLYPGNDFHDLVNPYKARLDLATGRPIAARKVDDEPDDDGLRLGTLAEYAVKVGPLSWLGTRLGLSGQEELAGYPLETILQVLRRCFGCYHQSLQQAARLQRDPELMPRASAQLDTVLGAFDGAVRRDGSRLLVAVLPTRSQIEPERARPDQAAIVDLLRLEPSALRVEDDVERALLTASERRQLPTLSLRQPLAAANTSPLSYSVDWHLNPTGHQVVAAALARAMLDQRLLPGR
jgi:hypothetical protein